MLSSRLFLVVVCVLLSVVSLSADGTPPNTPANGATAQPMCMLSALTLDGLEIFQTNPASPKGFASNHFSYQCTCDSAFVSTIVRPTTVDGGSSAEVTFNGVKVNHRSNSPPNGISNDGKATTDEVEQSPKLFSDTLTFKTGLNTIVIGVGCNGKAVPNCYYEYTIQCTKAASSGGQVVGDPQFVGLRGQEFQVHGVSGEVYNIVSDSDVQYNSRFVFLTEGECPRINGIKQKACWSHPGSYLGELGLKTKAGDKIHVLAGAADDGFAQVDINGKELEIGDTVFLAGDMGSVTRNSTHLTSVQIGNWDFAFENSDMFVNQRVRVFDALKLRSHGLLGQTWRETTYPNAIKYIQGEVDDYVIRGDEGIFGDAFVYNAHN